MKQILTLMLLTCGLFCAKAQVTSTDTAKNGMNNEETFSVVEQEASFPGGQEAMYRFMADNLIYPRKAREEGIQGRVLLEFVVEKEGTLSNIKVIQTASPELDAEALRVISIMPKWEPATIKGQPVRSRFRLPFNFQIQDTPEESKPAKQKKKKR